MDGGAWGCKESDMTEWLHFHFLLLTERNSKRIFAFMTNGKKQRRPSLSLLCGCCSFCFCFLSESSKRQWPHRRMSPSSYAQHLSIKPAQIWRVSVSIWPLSPHILYLLARRLIRYLPLRLPFWHMECLMGMLCSHRVAEPILDYSQKSKIRIHESTLI